MIQLSSGAYLLNGKRIVSQQQAEKENMPGCTMQEAKKGTIAYSILQKHNTSESSQNLELKFDALASHDITYVGIIQTARASGLTRFPIPYVLTNCHNSLCAVGGTINEDDHLFGLSAVKKYGGIYVPAHQAVIHQYMREMMAGCGKMILGSDSHTRYGALGTMAIGEGGPELVKQLLQKTYDVEYPDVVAVYLTGKPQLGVGPQDVALSIIGAVFKNGFVKNKVMEFVGDGIANLSVEYRNGIDVMTTETTCLSSIWATDSLVEEYLQAHGRQADYQKLEPKAVAYYDAVITVDLSQIKPMIALPFHPSNVYAIEDLKQNLGDILSETQKKANEQLSSSVQLSLTDKIHQGELMVEQGVIAGCAGGTYENICAAADILDGCSIGSDTFSLSVYPSSQPTFAALIQNGSISKLMQTGATIRSAFCGPCFGAGDVPANGGLSIRHSTRNFPNREGSKPSDGQIASVALMDARSIAATARNGGKLTAATELRITEKKQQYFFDRTIYENRCYNGVHSPNEQEELKFGPNIKDWPKMDELPEHLLLGVASVIDDPVTTTDELIPSGETSSYRSNPLKLAEFTLSRKDPTYVPMAKSIQAIRQMILKGINPCLQYPEFAGMLSLIKKIPGFESSNMYGFGLGSTIYANKPGDGSAREQAASCQKVLGGWANIAREYATKRYRSNLINWGMIPLLYDGDVKFQTRDAVLIPYIRQQIERGKTQIDAYLIQEDGVLPIQFGLSPMTETERQILLDGCLMNYYQKH